MVKKIHKILSNLFLQIFFLNINNHKLRIGFSNMNSLIGFTIH